MTPTEQEVLEAGLVPGGKSRQKFTILRQWQEKMWLLPMVSFQSLFLVTVLR